MGKSCQIVLLASTVALGISGCYLDHGRSSGSEDSGVLPTPARDASLPVADAAIGPIDAGPPPRCPAVRADTTCLESFSIAPGRPFSLPFAFDQCACCAETECRVEVDPASRTLSIATTLCPDPCDCDACNAPRGSCEVPALDEGDWTVIANGAPAFVLPVSANPGIVPPPPACAAYAEVDDSGCRPTTPLPGRPLADVCVEHRRGIEELDRIVVHHPCWPCAQLEGACLASIVPRFTDDLPPGGEIVLQPTSYPVGCEIECPAVCVEHTLECYVPPLVHGDTYRVHLGEREIGRFTAGTDFSSCAVPLDSAP